MTTALNGERVIVVGAGIAGTACAFRLQQAGADVLLLERGPRVGGRMSTVVKNGYRIDRGAILLLSTYTEMLQLIADADLNDHVVAKEQLVGIVREGVPHRFHPGLADLQHTKLFAPQTKQLLASMVGEIIQMGDKFQWSNLALAADLDVESALDYAARRLNQEAIDFFGEPMAGWGAFAPLKDQSVLNLFVSAKGCFTESGLFTFADGLSFLPEALAKTVTTEVDATVTQVEDTGFGVRVTWDRPGECERQEDASYCVISTLADSATDLYPQMPDAICEDLGRVRYTSTIAASIGTTVIPEETADYIATSPTEYPGLSFYAMDHLKAPGRAPDGHGLITTYWMDDWAKERLDSDDKTISEDVVRYASRLMPEIADHIDMVHLTRWPQALPVRGPGGYKDLARFSKNTDTLHRVALAGDYCTAAGTNNALCSGENAARRILDKHTSLTT
ncbi:MULTISPECIES: protoporphyrinogen/coproporphyrinogen oxidase [Streptomyces]|uniref:Oxygen-dependent protoporphyrinogen oxidase n=1 Tax=Streptomyces spectabilis TaxID=68270 RepID=A0A7W8B6P3_STRST|nr:NAD(P)/FAD-dependent oxidoreductase [Streptomyces spectabilis]MBB5109822.1 oxygen-dependent protoporphyrinogen oxidase [Streptomyces spectabilis]GGV57929.1 oxidoreductase [Streptomyces spectabilis]